VPYAAPTRHYFKNLACGHAEMRGELLLLGPLGSAHTLPCPAARTLLPAEWRCITPRGCLCTERWQQYTDTALSDSASHSGRPPRARTVLQQVAGVVSLACVASVPQSLLVAVVYEGVACWHTPPGTCACAGAPRRRMLVRLPRSACECGSTALLDKHASGRPFSPPRCQASPKGQCTSSAARRCRAPARAGCARAQALGYWSAP